MSRFPSVMHISRPTVVKLALALLVVGFVGIISLNRDRPQTIQPSTKSTTQATTIATVVPRQADPPAEAVQSSPNATSTSTSNEGVAQPVQAAIPASPQRQLPQYVGYSPRTFDSPAAFDLSTTTLSLKPGDTSATITATAKSGASLEWSSTGTKDYITANQYLLDNYKVVLVFDRANTIGDSITFHIESSPDFQPPVTFGFAIIARDLHSGKSTTQHLAISF